MKKQEGSGQEKKVKREELQGIAPHEDHKIVREVQEGGSVRYFHPTSFADEPENVTTESLYNVVTAPILRLKAIIDLLGDDDYARFGFVAEGIVEHAERLYGEVFHFLESAVGGIKVDVMGRHSVVYRPNRVLGMRIEPPTSEAGSQKKDQAAAV